MLIIQSFMFLVVKPNLEHVYSQLKIDIRFYQIIVYTIINKKISLKKIPNYCWFYFIKHFKKLKNLNYIYWQKCQGVTTQQNSYLSLHIKSSCNFFNKKVLRFIIRTFFVKKTQIHITWLIRQLTNIAALQCISLNLWKSIQLMEPHIFCTKFCDILTLVNFSMHRFIIKILIVQLILVSKLCFHTGLMFCVTGKVSVGGNSRSRTFSCCIGQTSKSRLFLQTKKNFALVKTTTGCLGVVLYYYF